MQFLQSRLYKIKKFCIFFLKKFAHIKKKQYLCTIFKKLMFNN